MRIGGGPVAAADAAAGHRRRGLARLDRAASRAWAPSALAVTHFGTFDDVDAPPRRGCAPSSTAGAEVARNGDEAALRIATSAATFAGQDEEQAYLKAMPPETLYGGLARYWKNVDTAIGRHEPDHRATPYGRPGQRAWAAPGA